MLKEILENKREKHISSGKFSISSIGCCWRKKYMELKKLYKEEYDEKMFRIFAQGDFFHQRMVSELTSKGPSQGYQVAAAECDIRNNSFLSGRCDCILSHAPSKQLYIVDFKSCSPYAFKNVQKGIISETYKNQVLLYEHIFHIKRGYLLFINKASSEVEEFEVEYDADKAEFLVNQIKYFFTEFIEKDKNPPRCDGGQWGCKCCWSKEDGNKPSKEQLEATLKQQSKFPELFREFESKFEIIGQQPKTEITNINQQGTLNQFKSSKWVKV